jgi:hypothetical protein
MVEMIGLTTLCMLVWVLTLSLATESKAEKRRLAMLYGADLLDIKRRSMER